MSSFVYKYIYFSYLGVDVYGTESCSDPGLTCDRKADDKCLQMLNTTYKVTPWLSVLIPH